MTNDKILPTNDIFPTWFNLDSVADNQIELEDEDYKIAKIEDGPLHSSPSV